MHIIQLFALYGLVYGHFLWHDSNVNHVKRRSTISNTSNIITTQVLIIGAGLSGLEAARLLKKNGVKTVILEARNRTGGRIWSIRSKHGHVLDMGASFIHGINGSIPSGFQSNPIWDLTQEAKIPTRATKSKRFLGSYLVNTSREVIRNWFDEYMTFIREETRISLTNTSLSYYVNLFAKQKNFTQEQQQAFAHYLHFYIGAVEGAELDAIGAKNYLDTTSVFYGKEHIFPETGFMALIDYLAKNITEIRLEQIVTKISYNEKLVEVLTRNGQIYQAEFVLITVPLGVLKSKQIEFIPSLPRWKLDVIDRIGFGNYEKVFLLWNQVWWNSSDFYYVRVSNQSVGFRYYATSNTWNDKVALECIFAGKADVSFKLKHKQDQIVEEIRNNLQKLFRNTTIPPPDEIYMTNWNQDIFSFGSYSFISFEQKYEDFHYLAEPINYRLLFAGEATTADTYGYTHGALLSARREVTRLLLAYDLLPKPNTITSQSVIITPIEALIIINFIWLDLYSY